jgi:hypothetical protein
VTIEQFYIHPVVVLSPTLQDDRYSDTDMADWSTPVRSGTYRGWLAQTSAVEVTDGRAATVTGWVLELPVGVPVTAHSRVEVAGTTFEVDGEPWVVSTPRGPHHVKVKLQEVAG